MGINSASGTALYIGGVQSIVDPSQSDYQADSYILVGEIENLGNFGDKSAAINFTSLADSRVRKLKGPRDAGTMQLTVGDDPTDEGQLALVAAEQTHFEYNFKVVGNDSLTLNGADSISYFHGQVMSREKQVGTASNIVKRVFEIGINSSIIELAPT